MGAVSSTKHHIIVTTFIQRRVQIYEYSKKEASARASRRIHYYNKSTCEFSYGKDLRLYNLKDRLLDNYKLEIKGYTGVLTLIKNKEYALSFLSLFTLFLSDLATYGILAYLTVKGMSIANFSMYLTAILTLTTFLTKFTQHQIGRAHV